MLFNSYQFIFIFLPSALIGYFLINKSGRTVTGKLWLILMSTIFYGYWNVNYLPLLGVSIVVNYIIGSALNDRATLANYASILAIRNTFSRRSLLIIGLAFNILTLSYFKYAGFFVENLNWITNGNLDLPKIILPLAISFFTFQKIAYLIDCYKGQARDYGFVDYVLFVMFFPQLIAGPIVHHSEIVPQFENSNNTRVNYRNVLAGTLIFSVGLFKKVVIADTFSIWANAGFNVEAKLDFAMAWATSLSYTFQLYFDFSGYTDMAIGAALMFNIRLPKNFNSPYKAANIQDFWRRWHITLGSFMKTYIYIPLGGNKKGNVRASLAIAITFLIGGLWHGASWMFVIWGALHGFGLIVCRMWQLYGLKIPYLLGWFITFNFVNVAWVFFRAENIKSAFSVLNAMFINIPAKEQMFLIYQFVNDHMKLTATMIALGIVMLGRPTLDIYGKDRHGLIEIMKVGVLLGAVALVAFNAKTRTSEFLYFNF